MEFLCTLRAVHARTLASALPESVHPAFVRLLLHEGTLGAQDVLENLWPADVADQIAILREHLPLLWSRAPEALVSVLERLPPGPRAEQLSALAALAPSERDRFASRARSALAEINGEDTLARARALLALARSCNERAFVNEALPLLPELKVSGLARLATDFAAFLDHAERALVREIARDSSDRGWACEVLLALARVAPPDEGREDATAMLERGRDGHVIVSPWKLPQLVPVLSWEGLRRWVDPHLRHALGLWDACNTVPACVSFATPDQLDAMVEMIERGRSYPWDRVRLLALVSRHHPARAGELLDRARSGLPSLLGHPGAGDGANPAPVGGGRAATVHQVHALFAVAAATSGDERRDLQQRALAYLATDVPEYDEHGTIAPYHWQAIGQHLDPKLRGACVDVLLAITDRHSCWGAIGHVVACFPEDSRRLALVGLTRVTDGPPSELTERARAELDAAVHRDALFPFQPPDDALGGEWDETDAASLAPWSREIERRLERRGGSDGGSTLRRTSGSLTPRAALQALAQVRTLPDPRLRLEATVMLIGASDLGCLPELPTAVAEALALAAEVPDAAWNLEDLPIALLAVCPPADATWRARLAAVIGSAPTQDAFWELVRQFAPAIVRTAGPEPLVLLATFLEQGLPLPKHWAESVASARATLRGN